MATTLIFIFVSFSLSIMAIVFAVVALFYVAKIKKNQKENPSKQIKKSDFKKPLIFGVIAALCFIIMLIIVVWLFVNTYL